MDKPIVAAVKKAVAEDSNYWGIKLPAELVGDQKMSLKTAYYGNFAASYREDRCEYSDFITMKAAANTLKNEGIRGLCFY